MSPSDHPVVAPRSPSPVRSLAALVALVLIAAACGVGSGDDGIGSGAAATDGSSTSVAGAPVDEDGSTTTGPTATTQTGAETDAEGRAEITTDADLAAWAGRYVWEEAVEGNPGSAQVLVHELVLDVGADEGEPLSGALTQNGFQTATELTVTTEAVANGIAVLVVSVDAGLTSMEPGDLVVTLTGDPTAPITTIGALIPLVVDRPDSGRYFEPEGAPSSAGGTADGRPGTFWAIEARTFDVIQVDVASGAEVGRITGWGAPPGGDPSLVLQALQHVDVSPDGWLWLDDCCEPAFGNVFGLDPSRVENLEQIFGSVDGSDGRQLVGLSPATSPDGSLLAWGNGPFEVTVADGRGIAVGSVLTGDDDTFAYPLAWLDDTTLAAAVAGRGATTITFWDLSTPSAPVQVGSPQVVAGLVADAARAEDGTILVVFGPEPVTNPSRSGAIVSPGGSEPIEVPDGLASVDRDPSGQHLLWVGADGLVRTGPLGGDAPVLSGIEVLSASW